jgi:N-formylmaleamate deformylase
VRQIICFLVLALVACGAGQPEPARSKKQDRDTPFARDADFEPVAFGVEVEGEGDGAPVILIPGLGCPGEVWTEVAQHLGENHETHTLTLSGFAGRPAIDEPLSEAVRRDLARYIRAKRLWHPIIIGHSMGGFIAFWMASYHPELVGPIVIVDASPALSGDLDDAKYLRDRWRNASDEQFFGQVRAKFMSMTRNPRRMKPIIDLIVKSDRAAIGDAIFEMMQTNLTKDVANIVAPVLIVAADGGYRHRIKAQTAVIPNHEMVVLPGTGHFVMWDDPDGFFRVIDRFIAENSE